jgi:hypothetical protein
MLEIVNDVRQKIMTYSERILILKNFLLQNKVGFKEENGQHLFKSYLIRDFFFPLTSGVHHSLGLPLPVKILILIFRHFQFIKPGYCY